MYIGTYSDGNILSEFKKKTFYNTRLMSNGKTSIVKMQTKKVQQLVAE